MTGENGLLTKTSDAQFKTEIATYKEELKLSILTDEVGTFANRTDKFNETEYSKIKQLIPSFNKKYENILVIQDDKLVYKGNDVNLYRKAIEEDLIADDELINDDIIQELKPFITMWKTDEANEVITLPLATNNTYDCTIDFGDGTEKQILKGKTTELQTHTYVNAGTYTIKIEGTCPSFDFISVPATATKIIKVEQFGATNLKNLSFSECTNLEQISEPSTNSFINLNKETFEKMFYNCSKLESIPDKLFCNIPTNVTNLAHTFVNCSNIKNIPNDLLKNFVNLSEVGGSYNGGIFSGTGITSIPENIFKYNTKIVRLGGAFSNCKELTSIPDNLFAYNMEIINFGGSSGGHGCFMGCSGLTSIPSKLFNNNIKATNFIKVFNGCSGIKEIPNGLFDKNINAKEFLGTFDGCSNIKNIPSDLFKYNTEVTTFRSCFSGCKNIEYLPEGIFDNCQKVQSFYYTFYNCTKMQGTAPALWERENIDTSSVYNYQMCFSNCTLLTNYNEIPTNPRWR